MITTTNTFENDVIVPDCGNIAEYTNVTVANSYSCTSTASITENIYGAPKAGYINLPEEPFCSGSKIALKDIGWCTSGAPGTTITWSFLGGFTTDPVTLSTISASIVPGDAYVTLGTVTVPTPLTILFTISSPCGTVIASTSVIILPPPNATIYGLNMLCVGASTPLYLTPGSSPGGTWSSSNPAVAYVSPSGTVTGLNWGKATISYYGIDVCGKFTASYDITVVGACAAISSDLNSLQIIGYPGPSLMGTPPPAMVTVEFKDASGTVISGGGFPTTVPVGTIFNALSVPPGTVYISVVGVSYGWISCEVTDCCYKLLAPGWFLWKDPSPRSSQFSGTNQSSIANLSIIPNPNKGTFILQGSIPNITITTEATLEVVDMLGKTILTDVAPIENGSINKTITLADNIANGMYMVRIKAEGTNKVIKFTLER